ncbi:MAG: abortive infection protein [Vicinamibacterales bacterium]
MSRPSPLAHKGVNYDVGTNYSARHLSRPSPEDGALVRDFTIIREELHATDVRIFGTAIDDLVRAAGHAIDAGLAPWVSPRLIGVPVDESLDYLAAAARAVEPLRARAPVSFVVGCEASQFVEGIVEGRDIADRQARMFHLSTLLWNAVGVDPGFQAPLNRYLGRAVELVRAGFGGPVTYAAGVWERVDWTPFDVIGLDYYRTWHNRLGYRRRLRALRRTGKPVVVLEFGCCTYEGAADRGGHGQLVAIDFDAEPPVVREGFVRSEAAQAAYVRDLLAIYEEEGLAGAFVFVFVDPAAPHADDPRHDLDTASFALVTAGPPGSGRSYADGHRAPKAAFAVVASRYGATS